MISALIQRIKDWWSKMFTKQSIKSALGIDLDISAPMVSALETWSAMYTNSASWLTDYVKSMNLPAAIASEIARSVTIEMAIEFNKGARANYLAEQMAPVLEDLREQVEYGCAKGGLMFKPYIVGKEIHVDYCQADQFFPTAFSRRNITACIFTDQRKIGDNYFTRLEYHQLQGGGVYYIRNVAFRGSSADDLGSKIELTAAPVEEWVELRPETFLSGIDKPLFGYFRYAQANNVDPNSSLGVSCYSRAVNLIENADVQYSDLVWEFTSGRRAIYVDELAFDKDADDKPIIPDKRLYRTLRNTSETKIGDAGKLFDAWTPEFRDASIKSGLDAILKRIEVNTGLAAGALSDPNTVDRTATEILASKQRTAATIRDNQKSLERATNDLLYGMDKLASFAGLGGKGKYEVSYDFDDSLIADKQQQWSQDSQMVGMGAMSKVELRMRTLGESEEVAKQKVADAQDEMPEPAFPEGV